MIVRDIALRKVRVQPVRLEFISTPGARERTTFVADAL
jgi:hypothetical protein